MTNSIVSKEIFKSFNLINNVCIVSFDTQNYSDMFLTCTQTTVKLKSTMSYEEVVSKLIRARYTADEEFALINNALEDIANLADNAEYKEYQEWRSKCKETAKTYLKKDEEGQAE